MAEMVLTNCTTGLVEASGGMEATEHRVGKAPLPETMAEMLEMEVVDSRVEVLEATVAKDSGESQTIRSRMIREAMEAMAVTEVSVLGMAMVAPLGMARMVVTASSEVVTEVGAEMAEREDHLAATEQTAVKPVRVETCNVRKSPRIQSLGNLK